MTKNRQFGIRFDVDIPSPQVQMVLRPGKYFGLGLSTFFITMR
jgi:hypothetical protein